MNTTCAMLMILATISGGDKGTRFDFEDAAVGKLPEGWTADKTGKGAGSVWKIVEDKDAPKGPKVLAQTSGEAPGALFNLCVYDKAKYKDLDLSVSFKAVAGEVDQGGGLVWRYQDANNYYVARANPLENNFRFYKVVDGKRTQFATASLDIAKGKWHTIRIVHKGDHIECFLNGSLYFDVKQENTFKDAGKIGLWTKADAQTYFDNLVIAKAE